MKIILLSIFTIFFSCTENATISTKILKAKSYTTEIEYLKKYAKNNNYNNDIAFMIDYSLHSGQNRYFIVDLKNDSIIKKALVCHGSCSNEDKNAIGIPENFSNVSNSLCSTLGMAVVSERAYSSWGDNYKFWLDGLETNNKNMRKRIVVLHAWEGVPDEEIYPKPLAMSWGCPTVSIEFLEFLDEILKNNNRVLLYSFK